MLEKERQRLERKVVSPKSPPETPVTGDMPWINVGAKIGLRLLNSTHVHRALNHEDEDETDTVSRTSSSLHRLSKPIHSIWTSPGAAASLSPEVETHSPIRPVIPIPNLNLVPLQAGIKVAVPLLLDRTRSYQMGTVTHSRLIDQGRMLSTTVLLDKCFLRNGQFATLTYRTTHPDHYRHSKVPVGACVRTAYGLGVLVGWRVEDDCHVVRSLWWRGAGHCAYLQRSAIYGTMEAVPGFNVETDRGEGVVQAYVNGGHELAQGHFLVELYEDGRPQGKTLEMKRYEIKSCPGARFIPVIEHIRDGAHYQIQVDNYEAAIREQQLRDREDETQPTPDQKLWQSWTACLDILWSSFLKAVDEDADFDDSVNRFMTGIIRFLDRLDQDGDEDTMETSLSESEHGDVGVECVPSTHSASPRSGEAEPGLWLMNDFFGFQSAEQSSKRESSLHRNNHHDRRRSAEHYDMAFAILRTIMKTVSIARAESADHHHFRMALAVIYDFLLFLKTIVKVQQKNVNHQSLQIWKRAFEEIGSTFGPIKDRMQKIGQGIVTRMEQHGRQAKVRLWKFVDAILGDERLIFAIEQGEWDQCALRVESALVKSEIIDEANVIYYRKTATFLFAHLQEAMSNEGGAATRNNEKLAIFAFLIQSMAAPRRSILKIFYRSDVLDLFERILVRVFQKEEWASRLLAIHASNFQSLRHLRMLKDLSTSGRLWIPLLDAADEEFSWMVSHMPENTKDFMCPLSSLFSLCVAQFHKICAGNTGMDWLDFLLEEDAVRIIHDIDMRLILSLEAFSRDVKEMMVVLPYYASIDDDFLQLMDEVNLDEFLKEASEAIDDPDKLAQFVREKATIAVERFLNYLPKMSIPVERRELGDGWLLSCHGEDGGDLTLSDVSIQRENLVCQIIGGDSLFFPMFSDGDTEVVAQSNARSEPSPAKAIPFTQEESVLDHIREMIQQAQRHGAWVEGVGGVGHPLHDRYVASVLQGVPVTSVLSCGIDLWRNLEIDDDELLEIAIRDVSYQIQLQKERDERPHIGDVPNLQPSTELYSNSSLEQQNRTASSFEAMRRRFNPRIDPTVLYLEMKKLTLNLDNFLFRIEKEKRTIFDPVFEGRGAVSIHNISIQIRVECGKERVHTSGLGVDTYAPILRLKELRVELEEVRLRVKETGFGADWLLNKAVEVFTENITTIVRENLREQIDEQVKNGIDNMNAYFRVHPELLLNILSISMDDLEEQVVWV